MLTRVAAGAVLAVAAGAALGIVGRVSDYLGPEARLLFALGAPWFVVAFAVGAALREPVAGAATGALALAVSVGVYYAVMLAVERRTGHGYAASMSVLWGAAAVPCGLAFGALGATAWSRQRRGVALALLGGTLAGEALLFLAVGSAGDAESVLAGELAIGTAVVLAAARPPRARLLTLGAAAALAAASADGAVRAVMRAHGWGG